MELLTQTSDSQASQAAPELQPGTKNDLDSQTTVRCSLPSSEASVVTSAGPLDLGSGPVGPLVNQDTMARALECFFAQVRTTSVLKMLCPFM